MQLHEKIVFFRNLKGWSQENMAEQVGMSLNGYAKIERGETDVQISRLEKVCEVLGIELKDIFGFNEKMIFNSSSLFYHSSFHDNSGQTNNDSLESAKQLINDLEMSKQKIDSLNKEVSYLQQQITDLRKINTMLEKQLTEE